MTNEILKCRVCNKETDSVVMGKIPCCAMCYGDGKIFEWIKKNEPELIKSELERIAAEQELERNDKKGITSLGSAPKPADVEGKKQPWTGWKGSPLRQGPTRMFTMEEGARMQEAGVIKSGDKK